jgi:isopenicillin N synthase-like dioxygenase
VFALSERFFHDESAAEKDACTISVRVCCHDVSTFDDGQNNRGYAAIGVEALDPSKPVDCKENFNLGLLHDGTEQPLPPLLKQHVDELQAMQKVRAPARCVLPLTMTQLCHSTCQRLLEAFAIALEVHRTRGCYSG